MVVSRRARKAGFAFISCVFLIIAADKANCEPILCSPSLTQTLISPAPQPGELFGTRIAASGTAMLVGACGYTTLSTSVPGSAYLFVADDGSWRHAATLLPELPTDRLNFGIAVALEGELAVVGNSDSVFVFERISGEWSQSAKLVSADHVPGDGFGSGLAIGDGFIAVVASNATQGGSGQWGAVYIFEESAGAWCQTAKLTSPSTFSNNFGACVDTDDGKVFVSTPVDANGLGMVYIFERGAGAWSLVGQLEPPSRIHVGEPMPYRFGTSVSIDGDSGLVGSVSATGGVYSFRRSGSSWTREGFLGQPPGMDHLNFGIQVALAGNVGVVGQHYLIAPSPPIVKLSRAHLYVREGGEWLFQGLLVDSHEYDDLVAVVSGHTVFVGLPYAEGWAGVIQVFATNCPVTSDWDGDGDVDGTDYGALERCLKGPGMRAGISCENLDLNEDGAVDLADFAVFMLHLTSP
jgi:hypothetical protein